MDKKALITKYVVCPFCRSDIKIEGSSLECLGCEKTFKILDGEIPSMLGEMSEDSNFTMDKWDRLYQTQKESPAEYKRLFSDDIQRQVLEYVKESNNTQKVVLEIGCGQGYLGEELAQKGWLFIGVDFSLHALKSLKKRLSDNGVENYLLIHGDIKALPIRDGSINLIYGGGVIEHFKNPQSILNHSYNSLAKGGVSLNAVPFFNIGNMLYRSFWGGIPNVPVLKQLAEFVHLKLLRGKHMVFGYELQFTTGQLKKFHLLAGFKPNNILIDRFDCHIVLHMIRNPRIKEFAKNLCKTNKLFWPMVKVIGIK